MNIEDKIKALATGMFDHLKEAAGATWDKVEPQALEYKKDAEQRWLILADGILIGELDKEYLEDKAKEEVKILESQVISLGIIAASETQALVNQATVGVLFVVINALKELRTNSINENKGA